MEYILVMPHSATFIQSLVDLFDTVFSEIPYVTLAIGPLQGLCLNNTQKCSRWAHE
jgi:hypothetical protein